MTNYVFVAVKNHAVFSNVGLVLIRLELGKFIMPSFWQARGEIRPVRGELARGLL